MCSLISKGFCSKNIKLKWLKTLAEVEVPNCQKCDHNSQVLRITIKDHNSQVLRMRELWLDEECVVQAVSPSQAPHLLHLLRHLRPCLLSTICLILHHSIPPLHHLHHLHHLLHHPDAPLVLLSTIRLHIQYLVISPGLSTTWWNLETQWNLHQQQKLMRVSYLFYLLPEFFYLLPEFSLPFAPVFFTFCPSFFTFCPSSTGLQTLLCCCLYLSTLPAAWALASKWSYVIILWSYYDHTMIIYDLINSLLIITCVWRQPL